MLRWLPIEAQAPTWHGGFVETHYTVHPQLIFIQRCEFVRMTRQALTTNPSSLGNIDAYTFATRWYPIMLSRAGLALQPEVDDLGIGHGEGLGDGKRPGED